MLSYHRHAGRLPCILCVTTQSCITFFNTWTNQLSTFAVEIDDRAQTVVHPSLTKWRRGAIARHAGDTKTLLLSADACCRLFFNLSFHQLWKSCSFLVVSPHAGEWKYYSLFRSPKSGHILEYAFWERIGDVNHSFPHLRSSSINANSMILCPSIRISPLPDGGVGIKSFIRLKV